jgi:hypothetical protein
MVMADWLRRVQHWNPVQQAARRCLCSGQLSVVAKIGGQNDRGRTSKTRPNHQAVGHDIDIQII